MRPNNDLQDLIRQANRERELLTMEQQNFAPIFNSKDMINKIERSLQNKEPIDEDKVNVGLLAAMALDFEDSHPFDPYAKILYKLWNAFLLSRNQPFQMSRLSGRMQKAYVFYKKHHFLDEQIRAHFDAINFSKEVDYETIFAHSTIFQWSGNSPSIPQGNYYSDQNGNPNCLGINPKQDDINGNTLPRVQFKYRPSTDIEVLKSTTKNIVDTWSVKGRSYDAKGGCIQYFNKNDRPYIIKHWLQTKAP